MTEHRDNPGDWLPLLGLVGLSLVLLYILSVRLEARAGSITKRLERIEKKLEMKVDR